MYIYTFSCKLRLSVKAHKILIHRLQLKSILLSSVPYRCSFKKHVIYSVLNNPQRDMMF